MQEYRLHYGNLDCRSIRNLNFKCLNLKTCYHLFMAIILAMEQVLYIYCFCKPLQLQLEIWLEMYLPLSNLSVLILTVLQT